MFGAVFISASARQISKTGCYTNVVCCEVLSSGSLARRATIQMLFIAQGSCCIRSKTPAQVQRRIRAGVNFSTVFFLSSFLLSFPRFGVAS